MRETYLSVNHPFFPLLQLAVCVGPGGMRINARSPTTRVIRAYKSLAEDLFFQKKRT